MTKLEMREYVAELETRIDLRLKKWKKESRIENGEAVQVEWQYEQSHIILDFFWHDGEERMNLYCISPRNQRRGGWDNISKKTETAIMDIIGNFAQIVENEHYE